MAGTMGGRGATYRDRPQQAALIPTPPTRATVAARRQLWLLLAVTLLDALGVGLVLPHIRLLARPAGVGWGFAAAVDSVYAMFQLVGGPVFGAAADGETLGRRGALRLATAGAGAAYGILGLWPGLGGVVCCRVIAGLFKHGSPVISACVADLALDKDVPGLSGPAGLQAIGRLSVAKSIGSVIGPVLGGYLDPGAAGVAAAVVFGISFAAITLGFHEVQKTGPTHAWYPCMLGTPGSSAVQTANAQATACAQEKAPDRRGPNTGTGVAVGPWAGLWQTPGAVPMTALWALMALGLSVFRGSLRPFVEQSAGVTDRIQLGWFQSALHLVEVVAGLVVGRFSAGLSGREHRALEVACGLAGCSVVACGWSASPEAVLVTLVPFYAALGTARVCYRALLSDQAKRAGGGARGAGLASVHAVVDSIMTAARLLGPTAAGVLVDWSGSSTAPHWVAAALFGAACTVARTARAANAAKLKGD